MTMSDCQFTALMYDSEDNIIKCPCGNPASGGVIGKDAYKAFCSGCSPLEDYEAKLVYVTPSETECKILDDSYVIKLFETKISGTE